MYRPLNRIDRMLIGLVALVLAGAAASVAFAGWFRHGTEIFMTYAANGLSWCF